MVAGVRNCILSVGFLALLACGDDGAAVDGSGSDSGAQTTTAMTGESSATTEPSTATGPTPGECDPGDLELTPACADQVGFGIAIESAGCYQPCDVTEDCDEGACARVWALPCLDATDPGCTECGGYSRVCVDAPPVAPTFPEPLTTQGGCFRSILAWDSADTMGLEVSATSAVDEMMSTGETVSATITLPSDEAEVGAMVGYAVSGSWCTDAPLGTIVDRYSATQGTVEVTVEPGPGDPNSTTIGIMTATIRNVVLTADNASGETLDVELFEFGPEELWCCPG